MKLLYVTSIIYPSKFANRIQILQMAGEFQNKLKDSFCLGGSDIDLENKNLNIENFNFSRKSYFLAFKYLLFIKKNKFTYIYSREERLLFFIILYNKLFFHLPLHFTYEVHLILENKSFWYKKVLKWIDKFVVLTSFIKKELVSLEVDGDDILVESDAVDLKKFDLNISKQRAREKLNLPKNKTLLGNTGTLKVMGVKKGIDLVLESLKNLEENIILVLVGGRKRDVDSYKKVTEKMNLSKRVIFVDRVSFGLIPYYQKAFDILLAPYPKNNHYNYYMSPLKLFEYMASKRPIIISDLPSIREVLDENNSILVEPDDPKKLAEGINKLLKDEELGVKISKQAFEDVQHYTWEKRANNILEFIK